MFDTRLSKQTVKCLVIKQCLMVLGRQKLFVCPVPNGLDKREMFGVSSFKVIRKQITGSNRECEVLGVFTKFHFLKLGTIKMSRARKDVQL